MNLTVLNPYDAEKCEHIVMEKFDANLEKKYGKWKINDYSKIYRVNTLLQHIQHGTTPRHGAIRCVIPCASFYYLNYLVELAPDVIADIGCGMNFFKNIVPGVVGYDRNGQESDVKKYFDFDFSKDHTNHFDCAFSTNALHFIPITKFHDRVIEFANIIKPGGRGYIGMNTPTLITNTPLEILLEVFNTEHPSKEQIAEYIDQQIKKLPLEWLVIDNLIVDTYREYIDGNIRLVFEKQ